MIKNNNNYLWQQGKKAMKKSQVLIEESNQVETESNYTLMKEVCHNNTNHHSQVLVHKKDHKKTLPRDSKRRKTSILNHFF
jgi:hypothetical protein